MSEKSPIEQGAEEMIEAHKKAFEALMVSQGCKTIEELQMKMYEQISGRTLVKIECKERSQP